MELKYYLSILWKWAWLLILTPLLAGTSSLLVSQRMEPIYQATTTILISPAGGGSDALNYNSLLTTERVAKTYAELITKRPLMERVVDDLHLNLTPYQLSRKINVVQPSNTQLLELRVEDSNPELAITIANSTADSFLRQHNQRRSDRSVYIEIVEPAGRPTYKLRPRIVFNTVVAAFAGIVIALGFIFLLDYIDNRLTRPEKVEEILRIPTLGTIPHVRKYSLLQRKFSNNGGSVKFLKPTSPFAEAHRILRTNIQFAKSSQSIKTLLITSALSKEGKTTTVANLGLVLAQTGMKVLLVDADLRAGMLHQTFGVSNQYGLIDLLLTDVAPRESFLLDTAIPNLRLLPSGRFSGDGFPSTPSELLASARMTEIIGQLGDFTDILLFDSPPVLAVTDAPVLASRVDGVLLVVASGERSEEEVKWTLYSLRNVGAEVLGTVMTRCKKRVGYYNTEYKTDKLDEIVDTSIPLSISLRVGDFARSSSSEPNGTKVLKRENG